MRTSLATSKMMPFDRIMRITFFVLFRGRWIFVPGLPGIIQTFSVIPSPQPMSISSNSKLSSPNPRQQNCLHLESMHPKDA